jgi:MFS family permease
MRPAQPMYWRFTPTVSPRGLLAVMCACVVLAIGMVAAVNLAVPMLAASALRPSAPALVWIVDTYVIVFACLVIPAGAAGDRFGRKGVLLAGLALFAAGGLMSALASTAWRPRSWRRSTPATPSPSTR